MYLPVLLVSIVLLSYIFWKLRQSKIKKIARAVAYLKLYESMGGEELSDSEVDALNQRVNQEWEEPLKRAEMLRQASVYADKELSYLIKIAEASGYQKLQD